MSSLRQQALSAFVWSFAERLGHQAIQFVVMIILARLLTPSDFGVVAMLLIFMAISGSIVESGFGTALIQKRDATHIDKSTAFWCNLPLGILLANLLFLVAPCIARFYNLPKLTAVTRVMSLSVIFNSISVVHNALMTKELAFQSRMIADFVGLVISATGGIWLALRGFGVWALVAQHVIMSGVRALALWIIYPWRPKWEFSTDSFHALWRFGSKMMYSGLLTQVFTNIYNLIIGRVYSAADLGYYQQSQKLVVATSHSISSVISQVNFPLLAKLQDDRERMRRVFRQVVQTTFFFVAPAMTALAVMSKDVIQIVFGAQWLPCAPYFRWMAITSILFPIHALNLNLVVATGRSDLFFRLEMIKRVLVIINIVINWRRGVMALILGSLFFSIISLYVNTFYTGRYMQCGILWHARALFTTTVAVILMAVGMVAVGRWIDSTPVVTVLVQSITGCTLYLSATVALDEPTLGMILAHFRSWRAVRKGSIAS